MRELFSVPATDLALSMAEVFRAQGLAPGKKAPKRIENLFESALDLFYNTAKPAGVWESISTEAFLQLYHKERTSVSKTPLDEIVPKADHCALFVLTIGNEVCAAIQKRFRSEEQECAVMLDGIASSGVEKVAEYLETKCALSFYSGTTQGKKILRHSPGYCGWELCGQREIFSFLKPGDCGITLTDHCFLVPEKSISGVIVAGNRKIHEFINNYPFCKECRDNYCRERIQS